MKEEVIEENLELIATRVPPGDNWKVIATGEVVEGLVTALTMYLRATQFKGHYR